MVGTTTSTTIPQARGPVSEALLALLTGETDPESGAVTLAGAVDGALGTCDDVLTDEDLQLSLFLLYLLHYGPAPSRRTSRSRPGMG